MIQDAKEYIHANYNDEGMSLNQVAAYVNVSPNHFSTVFRQETGENFIEYLTSVRLEHAKEMLRTTSRKTSEIGYEVGYKDPHYFSSLFKKVEGMTPKEYRGGNVG
jgi:two-component system response regulator YesN